MPTSRTARSLSSPPPRGLPGTRRAVRSRHSHPRGAEPLGREPRAGAPLRAPRRALHRPHLEPRERLRRRHHGDPAPASRRPAGGCSSEMAEAGIALDLSHLTERAAHDALEHATGRCSRRTPTPPPSTRPSATSRTTCCAASPSGRRLRPQPAAGADRARARRRAGGGAPRPHRRDRRATCRPSAATSSRSCRTVRPSPTTCARRKASTPTLAATPEPPRETAYADVRAAVAARSGDAAADALLRGNALAFLRRALPG